MKALLSGNPCRAMVLSITMLFFSEISANAQDEGSESEYGSRPYSLFTPKSSPSRPRNYIISPLISWAVLPGFDQWWEGQYLYAGIYTGTAIAGHVYADSYVEQYRKKINAPEYKNLPEEEKDNELTHGELERKIQLGRQTAFAAGSFSAYHSFRTAVTTLQPYGKFTFLKKEESPADLALAPFKFSYLSRWTTYVPLGFIGLLYVATANQKFEPDSEYRKDKLSNSDVGFSRGTSYLAGTHEEASFRGYIMPVFREWTSSDLWSNALQSLIFAAAHLNTVSLPVAQLGLGFHLGWVTQRNEWTLSEAIFIHAWWDVFALMAAYQVKKKNPEARLPDLLLPPLVFHF